MFNLYEKYITAFVEYGNTFFWYASTLREVGERGSMSGYIFLKWREPIYPELADHVPVISETQVLNLSTSHLCDQFTSFRR